MPRQTSIQLIGIGNKDRSDDGVGALVVEQLAARHPDWNALCVRQLLPEFVAAVAEMHTLFFVDGAVDIAAGEVQVSRVEIAQRPSGWSSLSHYVEPSQFMRLVQLFKSAIAVQASRLATMEGTATDAAPSLPAAWYVRIGIEKLDHGRQLSPLVAQAMARAASEIETCAMHAACP
jgi:hydrogenase maturation protease